MALPNASLIQTAMQNLYAAFADDKTDVGMRSAVSKLGWLTTALNRVYGIPTDIAIVADADSDNETVAEFIDTAGYGAALAAKSLFRVTTATNDLSDNALATASGAAVAIGDVFAVDDAGTGVVFLGNNDGQAFDNEGESVADFVSIGS